MKLTPAQIEDVVAGRRDLAAGLSLSEETLTQLRSQAHALFGASRWVRCQHVLRALAALGRPEPHDAVLMTRCLSEMGAHEEADVYLAAAQVYLQALDRTIAEGARS